MKKPVFLAIAGAALLLSSAVAHASGPTVDHSDWLTTVHAPPPAAVTGHDLPVSLEIRSECSTVLLVSGCSAVRVTLSYDDHGVIRTTHQDVFAAPSFYSPDSVAIASFVIPADAVAGDSVTYSFVAEQTRSYCGGFSCTYRSTSVRSPEIGSHSVAISSS
ncbi:MAG: hypothetical protein QOJ67_1731 [Acidimicrobiaceae bacterium]